MDGAVPTQCRQCLAARGESHSGSQLRLMKDPDALFFTPRTLEAVGSFAPIVQVSLVMLLDH